MKLQKLGGYASITAICAVALVIGILAITLPRLGLSFSNMNADPLKIMAAYETSPITFRSTQPFGVLIAIAFVVIALALQERMRANAPNLTRLAFVAASVAFALFLANTIGGASGMPAIARARDVSAYRAFTSVQNGFSSAAINAWGWALFLMGVAAIRTKALPRTLGYICLVCGIIFAIAFAMPNIPGVSGLVVFIAIVLLNIIGAIWLGAELIRKPAPATAQ